MLSEHPTERIPISNFKKKQIALKVATTSILSATGVVLSYLNPFAYVLIYGAKINPFVHFINVIAGVLLGPVYAVITAFIIASIRFSLEIGTILAFPGGMSGALIVGVFRELILRYRPDRLSWVGFTEPIGTIFIGGTIAAFIIPTPIVTFWILFALSAIPGCVLGVIVLLVIKKAGYLDFFCPIDESKKGSTEK